MKVTVVPIKAIKVIALNNYLNKVENTPIGTFWNINTGPPKIQGFKGDLPTPLHHNDMYTEVQNSFETQNIYVLLQYEQE